jgi:hypothetical protein
MGCGRGGPGVYATINGRGEMGRWRTTHLSSDSASSSSSWYSERAIPRAAAARPPPVTYHYLKPQTQSSRWEMPPVRPACPSAGKRRTETVPTSLPACVRCDGDCGWRHEPARHVAGHQPQANLPSSARWRKCRVWEWDKP